MANGWQIEDRCPQCGAPVALNETDRLLSCAYCQVRLYVATDGPPRYCLPVKPAPAGEIVMVPYWRVRALHYRCVPSHVRSALLDTTRLAAPAPGLPHSLGVRPQAVRLRFAVPALAARFLPPSGPPPLPGDQLDAALAGLGEEASLFETCVAPATSRVYAPVRLTRAVFDAVLNKRIAPDAEQWLGAAARGSDEPPAIRFLATLCPACGWQLEAARDSLVLLCVNCRTAWRANHAGLRQVPYSVLETDGKAEGGSTPRRYLPFWRVAARISGLTIESWADLVRFANLPKVVKAEWRDEPAVFWVPGFKAQPDQFLRLAQAATLARPGRHADIEAGAATPEDPAAPPLRTCYPVTLDEDALPAAVTVLVANLANPKTRVFPMLRDVSVAVTASHLVYVPLDFNGREYCNPSLQLTVQQNLLEWGARL